MDSNHLHPSEEHHPETELNTHLELMGAIAQPVSAKNHEKYEQVLQSVLPYAGTDEEKIIQTEIILALKLEGLIGKELTNQDSFLIDMIKDYVMNSPEKKESALLVAKRLMKRLRDTDHGAAG